MNVVIITRLRALLSLTVFVLPIVALAPGCGGPDFESVCKMCFDGTDAEIQACVEEFRRTQDGEAEEGCGSEWEAVVQCADDNRTCERFSTPACASENGDLKACRQGKPGR